jgi:hypothetical protein
LASARAHLLTLHMHHSTFVSTVEQVGGITREEAERAIEAT